MRMGLLLLAGMATSGMAWAGEPRFACQPHPVSVTGMRAPADLEVPLYTGEPGAVLKQALVATWKVLSPQGSPVPVTGCFHEGYVRLSLPKIPQCASDGCWIAVRWVVTEKPLVADQRPCQDLVGGTVAASRGVPGEEEKCLRQ